jgi:hypothetical protein
VSVNFRHAVFSLLDFLTIEAGTNRLSQNFGMELISQKSTDLTRFDYAGLGLAPAWPSLERYGLLQSNTALHKQI